MQDPKLKTFQQGKGCKIDGQAWIGFEEHGKGRIVLGDDVRVRPLAMLRTCSGLISVGDHTVIGTATIIHALGGVHIGSHVLISPQVGIYAQNHGIAPGRRIAAQKQKPGRVWIEDDVWIGAGAVIVGPVRLGTGAVIGAGAVITHSVEDGDIVGGNPARVLGSRR